MEEKDDWRLDKVVLEFKTYGPDEGHYVGSISFTNGDHESFRFKIRKGMAKGYIELIAADVVKGAQNLGDRLILSLGKQLGQTITDD